MAVNAARIVIVGCGPGSAKYLTDAARQAAAGAEVLLGSRRLREMFADCDGRRVELDCDPAAAVEEIEAQRAAGRRIAVLVSGDPGLFSLARRIVERFGREQCELIAAVSPVQVAFARLGLDWSDARIVSAHGRTPALTPQELAGGDKLAVLVGTREAMEWAARAAEALSASHDAFLCENLTLAGEQIRRLGPRELAAAQAASLAIVLLIRRSIVQ
jgi:precorrin-6y C5,15-methyltransferase (decarboxylating) CbiE subunit